MSYYSFHALRVRTVIKTNRSGKNTDEYTCTYVPRIILIQLVITMIFMKDNIIVFVLFISFIQFSGQLFLNLIVLILLTLVLYEKV